MSRGFILNFHRVTDSSWFEKVILFLKSKYIITGLEYVERSLCDEKALKNSCTITVDDGDRTFFTHIYPVLIKHQVPVTLFVSPDIMTSGENFWFQEIAGYDPKVMKRILSKELAIPWDRMQNLSYKYILKCMSINEIKRIIRIYQEETGTGRKSSLNMDLDEITEVESSGLVTIGAHTLSHPILKNEDDASSDHEITGSVFKLKELLGHEIKFFAYPNGIPGMDFGEREMKYLRKSNITLAVSTRGGYLSASDEMLSLPRFGLSSGSIGLFRMKLLAGSKWEMARSVLKPTEEKTRRRVYLMMIENTLT